MDHTPGPLASNPYIAGPCLTPPGSRRADARAALSVCPGGLGPCPSGRAPHPCRKSCWPCSSLLTVGFPTGLCGTHSWEPLPEVCEALLSPHLTSCLPQVRCCGASSAGSALEKPRAAQREPCGRVGAVQPGSPLSHALWGC